MKLLLALIAVSFAACSSSNNHDRPTPKSMSTGVSFGAIWDDPQRCAQQVGAGRRMKRPEGTLRVGTWNVRWFPDGRPGDNPSGPGTHLEWLGCTIAFLNVDVLGMQEIKTTDRGLDALAGLTKKLRELTGTTWKWVVDGCEADARQHVLFLYRTDRVSLDHVVSHGEIDVTAKEGRDPACPGHLRPALGAYVKSLAGGVDFHLITTHLDSGRKERDFRNREKAWKITDTINASRQGRVADTDYMVAADFNMMGCKGCEVSDGVIEQALLREVLANLPRPLVMGQVEPDCTEYYRGKGTTVDVIAWSKTMEEAGNRPVKVSGVCGASRCKRLPEELPVFKGLSDHCPLLFDVVDRDLD